MPKLVDPAQRLDPAGELRRLPFAVTEVVQVEVATNPHHRRIGSVLNYLDGSLRR